MLCLSRRVNERIIVGENIVITVIGIDRGKVKLGIEAPKDVSIWREEIAPEDRVSKPEKGK